MTSLRHLLTAALAMLLGSLLLASWPAPVRSQATPAVPLDRALRLIAEARNSYAKVTDYTCVLVKREQVAGRLGPENVIDLKVRSQPFSVYMHWRSPKALEGQEACYVAGKHNGLMRVHAPGLLGAVGFVNLDPKDARAQKNSRHSITEAGIGNIIEKYAERWETERKLNRTRVRIGEYEFHKCRCARVETAHPNSKPGECYSYRSVVYFDKATHLPIRTEAYDWPMEGGKPEGELMECFSFTDLKLNVGLADAVFNH